MISSVNIKEIFHFLYTLWNIDEEAHAFLNL